MLNGYVKQHWQSEKITKCRDYIEEIELHWRIASFYPESLPYFCHIFAIKHQNYKKTVFPSNLKILTFLSPRSYAMAMYDPLKTWLRVFSSGLDILFH